MNFAEARAAYEMAARDVAALGSDYADVEMDFYADARFKALDALMLANAPDLAALIYKLELFGDDNRGCMDYSSEHRDPLWAAIVGDLKRLAG